jgi:hypothetical protein
MSHARCKWTEAVETRMSLRGAMASLALWLSVAGGALADPQATPVAPPVVAPQSAPVSGGPASGNAPDQPDKALAQVTIEAQRAKLEHSLNTFVSSITRSVPRDESLRRWRDPICPLVAGLTRDEGEYLLQRLSQIARTVGAPLDKEHCARPNLVIFVTSKAGSADQSLGRPSERVWRGPQLRCEVRPVRRQTPAGAGLVQP